MPIFWLSETHHEFPPVHLAEQEGVLAIGGDLSPERLLKAYSLGIFPWYNPGEPILWWSPDPRFVLFPDRLKVSKSMRPYFNQGKFQVSFDQCFEEVIRQCGQQIRNGQSATWITEDMIQGYVKLHQMGYAHSVEVWKEKDLVGGLYGIALGSIFFGESMFTRVNNASKFGFISLVRTLKARGYWLIDCQQETNHLGSLGAEPIPRTSFMEYLERNRQQAFIAESWKGWSK
jgi:leucyl/phenylalanyl-tRNA--protein transferase